MLKKQLRLTKQKAFLATYKIRNSYHKDGIVLWVGKQKTDMKYPTRVGFVVSKKTHKRAVKRNRLKRLMRESYRLLLKNNNVGKSNKFMSLIFVGFEKALGKDFKTINSDVEYLLKKIRV